MDKAAKVQGSPPPVAGTQDPGTQEPTEGKKSTPYSVGEHVPAGGLGGAAGFMDVPRLDINPSAVANGGPTGPNGLPAPTSGGNVGGTPGGNAGTTVRGGGNPSSPTSNQPSQSPAQAEAAAAPKIDVGKAAVDGAKYGGLIGFTVSFFLNLYHVIFKGRDIWTAVKNVAFDSLIGAAAGAGGGAIAAALVNGVSWISAGAGGAAIGIIAGILIGMAIRALYNHFFGEEEVDKDKEQDEKLGEQKKTIEDLEHRVEELETPWYQKIIRSFTPETPSTEGKTPAEAAATEAGEPQEEAGNWFTRWFGEGAAPQADAEDSSRAVTPVAGGEV